MNDHQTTGTGTGSSFTRPYRSKRNRPCDVCRSRKVYCRIEETPPCQLCRKLDVPCTFVEGPAKRQQTTGAFQESSAIAASLATNTAITTEQFVADQVSNLNSGAYASNVFQHNQVSGYQDAGLSRDDGLRQSPGAPFGTDRVGSDTSFNFDMMDFGNPSFGEIDAAAPEGATNSDAAAVLQGQEVLGDDQDLVNENHQGRHAMVSETGVPPAEYPIDGKESVHGLYFGLSGETDPYLLRHYRYDEHGEFRMWKLIFRQAANDLYNDLPREQSVQSPNDMGGTEGSATGSQITLPPVPVHFMMAADELAHEAKYDTTVRQHMSAQGVRMELDQLIRPEDGSRLVGLFFNYVFPALPVVSRSQMGVTTTSPFPTLEILAKVPTHLLAAMYASSLAFCPFDDHLCVSNAYKKPPTRELWRLVFEEIFRDIHTPRLSCLQASLLYLQRPREAHNSAAADTPFRWSFMASTFALATSLGMHIECQDWCIPAWEKRLRRRLWWVTYSEEKWRSLLQGQPALITKDQWDVGELTDEDFMIEGASKDMNGSAKVMITEDKASALHFRWLASLAQIVDDVYQSFYTLRASRIMSQDFSLSLNTAQPLRHRLRAWYSSLPDPLRMRNRSGTGASTVLDSNASLHLAYLTLEVLLYRALLRPLGRSNGWSNHHDSTILHGHLQNPQPATNGKETDTDFETLFGGLQVAAEATISAAEHCARLATTFTADLSSRDFSGFWYSWSRIGFATISNFVLLLLIQAPTAEHAAECKTIADAWRQTLRFQSKSCEQMNMGMLRLDAIYWSKMENVFIAEGHVRKVL
ncbi:hypothetical protein BP6252_10098 [Coleophoma cylindrospora]|uniref:Zn(2)-C6 fungal-type domain-containing protein n=1 Tax=Coleophoma cylindrospora TaxID=1849047 RepID=A0A3D8QXA1_9HELO|nr:hypothetical protein BP6252_10098 [Coleophoma cylindrospora]